MEMYTVNHYWSNPRNNTAVSGLTRTEAIEECKRMTSEEEGQCSDIVNPNGEVVATRDWARTKLSWIK